VAARVVPGADRDAFQRMDDSFLGYGAKIDMAAKTIALTARRPRQRSGLDLHVPAAGPDR
jgi:hypothetical protein